MIKYITFFILTLSFIGCSSSKTADIKEWLKEGTKEYKETSKKITEISRSSIKDFLIKNGCVNGSSAKIIETKDNDFLLYEVNCVKDAKKFLVKCDNNSCVK